MSGVDFAAFPPEVNSGLMYSGSGSGPMVSAATAWDRLAAELGSAATLYREVISELTDGGWQGPSAAAMAAAAAPYVEWMNITAAQAAQTASQVRSAAAAYEAAFTATVPPPVIAANRALLSSLVSTNAFGQNNPAIAANQAQYAEMWAQDATAMYSYAGNSAAATQLTPFTAAPQNTNPAGAGAATAAVAQTAGVPATSVPNALQAMTVGGWQDPLAYLKAFTTSPLIGTLDHFAETIGLQLFALSGLTFGQAGIVFYEFALMQGGGRAAGGYWGAAQAAASAGLMSEVSGLESGALESTLASSYGSRFGAGGAGVSAGLGRAAEVGALSVPQSWASASEIRLAAKALPTAGLAGLPQVGPAAPGLAGMGGLGGAPIMGSVVDASRNGESASRYGVRSKLISALPGKPGSAGQAGDPAIRPAASTVGGGRPLSEHDELKELRRIAVDLARECEVLDRSATMLLEQVPAVGASE